MRSHALRRTTFLLTLSAALLSCGDTGSGIFLPPVLRPGTWYLHEANGNPVPALFAERFVGIAIEQTYLDSATLSVTTGGTWEQRLFLRVVLNGALDREELLFDRGTWVKQTVGWAFSSNLRSRAFTVSAPLVTLLVTTEPVLAWASAPTLTGRYRQTHP